MKTQVKEFKGGKMNGIDTDALRATMEAVKEDPSKAQTNWRVTTRWMGGTRSDTHVESNMLGGQTVAKDFTIRVDEPLELCGTNQFANPQETLQAAFNACMMVGYVALCALEGIRLESARIESNGDIDLRGFLGLSGDVPAGYSRLRYTVYLKGEGTPEQFERVHQMVMGTSPNRYNLSQPIPLETRLVVE